MNKDKPLRAKRGRGKLSDQDRRTHCVSVRLNEVELSRLDARRQGCQRGEYMRMAFMGKLPNEVPAINKTAWVELSKSAGNLNQIAKKLNQNTDINIEIINEELAKFRALLIGVEL